MKEVIIRLRNTDKDAELCIQKKQKILFKKISKDKLLSIVSTFAKDSRENEKIKIFGNHVIGAGDNYVVIKQPEHKMYVTYKNRSYKINFPNSIYVVTYEEDRVNDILCFCYKKYEGGDTELYDYAMPNMLGANRMCKGTADRSIKGDIEDALNKIIATPYSHGTFDGIKGFTSTIAYFEYLEVIPFPYKLLRKLNMRLRDVYI